MARPIVEVVAEIRHDAVSSKPPKKNS